MNALLSRANKYEGACFICAAKVKQERGYLLSREQLEGLGHKDLTRAWYTLCNSRPCAESFAGKAAVEDADRRCIDAEGRVFVQDDEDLAPFLRALGSQDPNTRRWTASPHRRDRDQVLRVAAKLGLSVDPAFAEYEDPQSVKDAVARARAIPTIREYQVVGTRWLAYRGLDDVHPSGFNMKDNQRGFLESDDPGVGKTIQILLALRDDEALAVVCNSSAKEVWPREAAKWRSDRFDKFTILQGEESFRWPENTRELVVLNYDILPSTPAQIEDEIEHNLAKLDGHFAKDPEHKIKWKRKDVKGLRKQLARALRPAKRLQASGALATTAGRHAYYLALFEVVATDIPAKIARVENALARARKRKPVDKGPRCPVLLVGDELHYVESAKALRTQRWRRLTRFARRVGGLTGTPFEADPMKGKGLLTSACANAFNWVHFMQAFNGSRGHYGVEFARHPPPPGSSAMGSIIVEPGTTEQLQRVLMRRTKEEVLPELPPKVFTEIPVPLTAAIRKQLDEITAIYVPELLAGALPPFEAMSSLLKALSKHCIPTLLDVVGKHEAEGRPVVVFAANQSPVEALSKRKGWFAAYDSRCYGGKNIGEIQDKFQAGEGVGVAGTAAIAESITLTRASNVVQVIPFMSRKKNKQAYDRCHRLGQLDTVNVEILVPDHVFIHHILALLVAKDQFVDDVLKGESTPSLDHVARFVDEPAEVWRARAELQTQARKKQADRDRRSSLLKREKELAAIASQEVTPKKSEQRAKLRAERLTEDRKQAGNGEPVVDFDADKATVQAALAHMLARCDGAREKDDAGFNAPDSAVARWLAPGVRKGSRFAVASMAAILKHYPRQLSGEFGGLFN